jgi:hypothetical protein
MTVELQRRRETPISGNFGGPKKSPATAGLADNGQT